MKILSYLFFAIAYFIAMYGCFIDTHDRALGFYLGFFINLGCAYGIFMYEQIKKENI